MRWNAEAIRGTLKMLGQPQSVQERALVEAIVAGTRDLVRGEEFDVRSDGQFVQIAGTGRNFGKSTIMMQGLMWRVDLPPDERVRMMLESYAARLQEFLSNARGAPWPEAGARPRVEVGPEQFSVVWFRPGRSDPVCEMTPIRRSVLDPE